MSQQGTDDRTGACHEASHKVLMHLNCSCRCFLSHVGMSQAQHVEDLQWTEIPSRWESRIQSLLSAGVDVGLPLHGSNRWGGSIAPALPALVVLSRCCRHLAVLREGENLSNRHESTMSPTLLNRRRARCEALGKRGVRAGAPSRASIMRAPGKARLPMQIRDLSTRQVTRRWLAAS